MARVLTPVRDTPVTQDRAVTVEQSPCEGRHVRLRHLDASKAESLAWHEADADEPRVQWPVPHSDLAGPGAKASRLPVRARRELQRSCEQRDEFGFARGERDHRPTRTDVAVSGNEADRVGGVRRPAPLTPCDRHPAIEAHKRGVVTTSGVALSCDKASHVRVTPGRYSGSRTLTVVPLSSPALSSSSDPPCASATSFATCRPIPIPAQLAAFPAPRVKAPPKRVRSDAGMPMPSSLMAISATPSCCATVTDT